MLLGSPPDMVHRLPLRKTGSSTLLTKVGRHIKYPGAGIHPCCSGLQVQGTAGSPTSAALSRATFDYFTTEVKKYQEGLKNILTNGKCVL